MLSSQMIRQQKQAKTQSGYQVIINNQPVTVTKTFASAMAYMSNRYKGQSIFGQGATIKPMTN